MSESKANNGQQTGQSALAVDQFSLADLVASLWRQKFLILAIVLLSGVIGATFALVRSPVHEYTTTIEIGSQLVDDQLRPIEPPQNVVAKLEHTFIPEAIRTYQAEMQADGEAVHRLRVQVFSPRDTDLVVLSSHGPLALADYYIPLHERVLDRLIEDHDRETEMLQARIKNRLGNARITLEELEDERVLAVDRMKLESEITREVNEYRQLQDQEVLLREELANLDVQEDLIGKRLETLSTFIQEARARRVQAQEQTASGADGLTLMLIDNELQRDIDREAELEDRLLIDIPEGRARLRTKLEDNQRQQSLQQQLVSELEAQLQKLVLDQERASARHAPTVRELETQLANLRSTRAVLPPRHSLEPRGLSRSRIVFLSLLLGLGVGVFAAVIVGFVGTVRRKLG
jgi:hypothetical protein